MAFSVSSQLFMLLERPGGPAIGSLQLSVATSLFFCVCGDALRKANRRFKPYSRLLLPALFVFFLHHPAPRVAGRDIRHVPSYDGCPSALSTFLCTMRMRGSFRDPRDSSLPAFGQMGCPTHTDTQVYQLLNLFSIILS